MRRVVALLAVIALSAVPTTFAQQPARQVREFIKVDAPVVALVGVRVIDGTGAPAREDQTIVLSGGKIQAVGPRAEIKPPADAKVLELAGHTVFPGMVGMHNHMYYPAPGGGQPALYPQHGFSFPRLYLAGGVTSMRTGGSVETYTDLEIRKQIDSGRMAGPRMYVTGPYLEGKGAFTPQMHELTGPDDARKVVEYWADLGVTSFKAYMNITRAELAAAIEAAHKRGIKVTGHLCAVTFREAADLGIDDLEHGLIVDTEFHPEKKPDVCPNWNRAQREMELEKYPVSSEAVRAIIRKLVEKKVAVTSTLPVFETFVPNRPPLDQRVLDAMLPEARISYLATRARIGQDERSLGGARLKREMEFERAFVAAGGLLITGLDPTGYGGVIAGFGDQRSVELLVEAGFTPVEAIKIATANGAEYLGELQRFGTITAGKLADVVVVRGNPAADIKDIRNVEIVFKDGVGYDPAKLIESVKGAVGLR